MRVLWLVERFPPQRGGLAAAAARRVRSLAAAVERLDVLHLDAGLSPGEVQSVEEQGATVHRVGPPARSEESGRLLLLVGAALARHHRHDLLHGFYGVPSGYLATLLAAELGLPSVVALRGNDVDLGMLAGDRQPLLRWSLERATTITCVSRELQRRVEVLVGRRPGVHFVANAVDAERFCPGPVRPADSALLAAAPRPWVGFSGELRFKKGLQALQGLAAAFAERGAGTVFALGGVRAEERAGVAMWRHHNDGASRRLVELPYRSDPDGLCSLLRAMDLMVFPSLWEGMPNALLEAMACGRPVLAHAVGGILDVVEAGRSGVLLDTLELGRLPERVFAVLAEGPARLESLGRAAREVVVQRHSLASERGALLEVYAATLRAAAAPGAPA